MALKKDSNSLGSEQEKSQNEDSPLLEFKNLDNKKEIESQLLEVSKGDNIENGFLDFGFNQSILNSLKNKGYKNPTPIQKAAIPELMLGRDLLGQAQTGTGKTAAFALPLIEKLTDNKELNAKVLVMTPTRELATQVAESFKGYSSESSNFKTVAIYGGTDYRNQISALKRKVDVVVGTPGRIMDHIRQGTFKIRDGKSFNAMLEMVSGVRNLGMEACVTAGMLTEEQASKLADAGLTAYNHNLDTSPEHYKNVITTRTYQDRLDTIKRVRDAGINVCCGGIIGLGETNGDRASLLEVLSNMNPHPESVPINSLVAIEGTGLEDNQEVDSIEMIRMIATARILMPKSKIRLSAGRENLSKEAQILCFQCGANSIFYGDELLTTSNPSFQSDRKLLKEVGVSFNQDFETCEKTLSSL